MGELLKDGSQFRPTFAGNVLLTKKRDFRIAEVFSRMSPLRALDFGSCETGWIRETTVVASAKKLVNSPKTRHSLGIDGNLLNDDN